MPRQQIGAPIRFDPDCVRHYLDVLHPALPRMELERPRPAGRNIPQSFRQPARVGSAWARIYGVGRRGAAQSPAAVRIISSPGQVR